MIANCKICNKEFDKLKRALTCSPKCSKENLRRLKYKPKGEIKLCKMCGKEFVVTDRSLTCSKKCSQENRRQLKRRYYKKMPKPEDRYFERIRLQRWRIKQRVIRKYNAGDEKDI